MKKHLMTMAMAMMLVAPSALQAKVQHLLPKPQQITATENVAAFTLSGSVTINYSEGAEKCALLEEFFTSNGCTLAQSGGKTVNVTMVESIEGAYDYQLYGYDNEAYTLKVTADAINITAVEPIGVIRAAQTLTQMAEGWDGQAALEAATVKDWPAFKLRGYMHDVGRSFISADELVKQIELFSRFKVNTFHWHMTENQAWRFEVKAYPKLTSSESMTRFAGQYYTQEDCKKVLAAAKKHGVIVIPEIDMPGHSEAFQRAMGFDMQSEEGKVVLKKVLDEVAELFVESPYIDIGGDEVSTTAAYLNEMIAYVQSKGKKAEIWNPINGISQNDLNASLTHMWGTRGILASGKANIDSRYNYTNHFDVFADLVGIYKSTIYYKEKGDAEVAGSISACWNDRKTPTQEDIMAQNNIYANVIATAERAWIGGGKRYIDNCNNGGTNGGGGVMLPNSGEEYEEFKSWETRFLFHKANSLKGEPIPYVKQTNVRWRITDAFPNGGNTATEFAPEAAGKSASLDLMPETYTHEGKNYYTGMATGAGIYLSHTWGNSIIKGYFESPAYDQTAYAWTYVYSPEAQEVGAQIEFQNYSRSEQDPVPTAGNWDLYGSKIWLNGEEIQAPTYKNAGKGINREVDLLDENFPGRKPIAVTLNKGWNKVFLKLPYKNAGYRLDKWMFTFVLTDKEGVNAVDGLIYSPNQCMDEATEIVAAKVSEVKRQMGNYLNDKVGCWPMSLAGALNEKIAETEATYSESKTLAEREAQVAEIETAWTAVQASMTAENINKPVAGKTYRMFTPQRGNRYPTSYGNGQAIVGEQNPATNASVWKFVVRQDGSYDIKNFHDLTYISPASADNTALNTVKATPNAGWAVKGASVKGLVTLTSGSAQFNQTNNANQGFKVFNWGSGTNTDDTGCMYQIDEVSVNADEEGAGVSTDVNAPFKTTTIVNGEFAKGTVWYTMQIGASQHIISDNGTADKIALQTSKTDLEAADLWCFVGNAESGYKIYNKQAGATKVLASSSTMNPLNGYGGTGGATYPTLQPEASLPNGYIGAWDLQASDKLADTEGYYLMLHGTQYAVNNFGNVGNLAFWAEGKDAGSTVTFTFAEATVEVNQANGTFTASNANNTWHSKWESNQLEGFSLGLNANNMQATNGYLNIYSGQSGSCSITLSAPEGAVVAEYGFDYVNSTSGYELTLTVDGTAYKTSSTKKSIKVTDGETRTASFTQSGANSGVTYSNFMVTVRRSMQEAEPQYEVFTTTTTSVPYRIPAIAQAKNGNLIAVADYRHSGADIGMATNGRIDIHGRISKDNGKTWGDVFAIIEGQGAAAAQNNSMYVAFGDPCLAADNESDKVMLLTCSGNVSFPNGQRNNHQGIARFYSEDGGETWGKPVDISESIYEQFDQRADGGIRCMFIGSGKISQSKTVKVGSHYRLYCAPLVKLANGANVNFVLYSDDFGGTWKVLGGVENSPIPSGGDEPKADELPDGSILVSSRTSGGRIYNIYTFTDVAKGEGSWGTSVWSNANNNGTVATGNSTNGEIIFVPVKRVEDQKQMYMMLQSVPLGSGRANVGIYYKALESLKDFAAPDSIAKDWDGRHQASFLGSAYSTMCWQADNTLAFLYEEETHCNTSRGGYTIVYKNYSIEQITDSAYTYDATSKAEDVVKTGIDIRKIQAGEGKYVGEYKAEAVAAVDEAVEAYKAAPGAEAYVAINKAVAAASRIEVEAGQMYRLRNKERQNGTLYLAPEDSRFSVATSNVSNANQIFTFVPATNKGEFYMYNPNYDLYLGKLVKVETQPIVTKNKAEAGIWKVESKPNGISMPINVNRESGPQDGLHLAGDNVRLVPWSSTSDASQWYIELVKEVPVTVPAAGYTTVNLPFAVKMPEGMKAYVAVEPVMVDDVLCMYIEEIAVDDAVVPGNTPVILAAQAGTYMLQFVNTEIPAPANGAWKGTLRSATVSGTCYTQSGANFVKKTNTTVSANKAYYVADLNEDTLPITLENGGSTGIDTIIGQGEKAEFYDLSGRRVVKPVRGIYVVNGRKVLK